MELIETSFLTMVVTCHCDSGLEYILPLRRNSIYLAS